MRDGHLEETLRRIIADALASKVKDPRIGFVTINEVRLNRDRTEATVFYTVMGEQEEREKSLKGLKSSARFVRGVIGDTLRLRTVPKLFFRYDDSLDRSFRLEELLQDLTPADSEDAPRADMEEDDA
jgi:ribosome-binding factor A